MLETLSSTARYSQNRSDDEDDGVVDNLSEELENDKKTETSFHVSDSLFVDDCNRAV